MTEPLTALCGDCLRVREFATWDEQEAHLCECGAPIETSCSCASCAEGIALLRNGERSREVLALQEHVILLDWAEDTGGVFG